MSSIPRLVSLVLCLGTASSALALELVQSTMDGGGGSSRAGNLELRGTIGQPEASQSQGGTLDLRGGFWAASEIATAVEPPLSPHSNRFAEPSPNPFNPRTTLRFELAVPGQARVVVYDVAGRRVRELLHQELPAGPHQLAWDGRDDRGRDIASGVYHVLLRSGSYAAVRKVTLVK